jgi:hypothetical protein
MSEIRCTQDNCNGLLIVLNPRGPAPDKIVCCIICNHYLRLSELEKLRSQHPLINERDKKEHYEQQK